MLRAADATPKRIRVGSRVQEYNLIHKVEPEYPSLAKQRRIQGKVRLRILIDKNGHVQEVYLIDGHQLLVDAARRAVKQWLYKPTLLDGQPVEVLTEVEIEFTLGLSARQSIAYRSSPAIRRDHSVSG